MAAAIGAASAIQDRTSQIPSPRRAESSPTALKIARTIGMPQIWRTDSG